jgi:hypothetical protein
MPITELSLRATNRCVVGLETTVRSRASVSGATRDETRGRRRPMLSRVGGQSVPLVRCTTHARTQASQSPMSASPRPTTGSVPTVTPAVSTAKAFGGAREAQRCLAN